MRLWAWLGRSQRERLESELIARHYAEVQNIYLSMRGWRHDYHNHLQTIKAYLALDQMDELHLYLDELEKDLKQVDTLIKSGNLLMDAILNSKLTLAQSHQIPVNATAQAGKGLAVPDVDLCVILGNLLDNAIESCLRVEDPRERFIRVYIGTLKQQLYICITNSMASVSRRAGGEFITSKGKEHGHGLRRIDTLVNRHKGFVNRQYEEGVFATEILLPL